VSPTVKALFDAVWGSAAPLESTDDVVAVLNAAGVVAPEFATRLDDLGLDASLDAATAAAVEKGVFGAPTIFVGDEMFFGNDRLHFIRSRLGLAA
jgi:2-hydroxychromene-2-carboxylate isomerase